MIPLWFFLSLTSPATPPPPAPVRVVDEHDLHVGVRPAAVLRPDELGFGLSIQVTAKGLSL